MVTKSNAQKYSFVLWEEVLEELIPEYTDVRTDRLYVDAAAMDLVRRPRDFDVIVSSNLFGDILSDLAAMVVGGLGMAPSANIRPTAAHRRCSSPCTVRRRTSPARGSPIRRPPS